jgi:quercetin dioxygenase-like cupin family protein
MKAVRRIITGHDSDGKAIFLEDRDCPHTRAFGPVATTNLWQTATAPADNTTEMFDGAVDVEPPALGSIFRLIEFPPTEKVVMHRTATLDYAIVLEGDIYAVLDDDAEKLMHPGDVLIQRGTNHGWWNRSSAPCTILFVLLDAKPISGLPTDLHAIAQDSANGSSRA